MKVEDLREKKHDLEFSDLAVGDVFKRTKPYVSWTFMKIPTVAETNEVDDCEKEEYNTVCLDDGDLVWFEWDDEVIKVEAKVVLMKNEE